MGSEQNRFPHQQPPPPPPPPAPRSKRWGGCWGGLSCFGTQKGGKRVVPASRQEANQSNGPQAAGLNNQTTAIHPSLLAPPSSPASFSNSALQSTAQSPNCFLSMSANSPGGPSSTMFRTGPYAHETQLVSPPVFSTYTTEPSTAPYTPPPELAHVTNPSSPDVPFAKLLSSSGNFRNREKANYIAANDLHATYSLYPGSPASSLRSPISRTSGLSSPYPDRDFAPQWDPSVSQELNHPRSDSGRVYGLDTASASKLSHDSNFFCPETFAQFYLDQSSLSQSGGRLSVSKETDVHSNGGNGHQNRHSKASKQDVEEIEAYRASFGFSADELVTTPQYHEISDVMEGSFTITPFTSNKSYGEETLVNSPTDNRPKVGKIHTNLPSVKTGKSIGQVNVEKHCNAGSPCNDFEDQGSRRLLGEDGNVLSDSEDIFSKMGTSRFSRKYKKGLSSSDAEVDYRSGRSLREGRGDFAWQY
ncbi:uncharacterized protein At1g76660 [Apium graveolens]|uniref:uncharacterized protein At1g76660 n=1 Tax=Apium graveolens TaxID=4045 RepID=UPI003D7B6146